ncbi:unnamed protein product [Rotaria magnacalcarata]|uniref:Uncharacterized protein n=1 Tax=Rotaria magnacalcarata TaxID=392030 RepID=A0A8S2WKX2_9BILA|nr:unnamed protein product [Rotaria magnacalcarata]
MNYTFDFLSEDMDNCLDKLNLIGKSIEQGHNNDVKGVARLCFIMAIDLSKELSMDLEHMLNSESIGEQPQELYDFRHVPNIDAEILN